MNNTITSAKHDKNDYPRDMSDPRWFQREERKDIPNVFGFIAFVIPAFVGMVGLPLLMVAGWLELAGVADFGLWR